MEIVSLAWFFAKWLLFVAMMFAFYVLWLFVINPYLMLQKYRKYPNVYVPKKLNAPSGDLKEMDELISKGKFRWSYLTEPDLRKYDIRLGHMGHEILFEIMSPKALSELNKLIPEKVDRDTAKAGSQFGQVFGDTSALKRSGKIYRTHRQVFLQLLGFNYASKFIPTMLKVIKEKVESWHEGEEINLLKEMGDVALKIIVMIAFGKDVNDRIRPMTFTNPDGSTESLDFYTFFPRLMMDLLKTMYIPLNVVFPYFMQNGWFHPNNINQKNCDELRSTMKDFLNNLEDKDSVYRQLVDEHGFSQEEIFDDLIGLLHAAHQTSHHTVSSALYFIKKHPEWLSKLREELAEAGIKEGCDYEKAITREVVHEAVVLAYIVKETLRIDPAGNRSLKYFQYEDAEICGVPIPRGSKILISMLSSHYNEEQFPNPNKFLPERFDPQSSHYYIGENGDQARHPLSYIPFSFNIRKCPGMILALIEVKTLICYLVSRIDYSIDEKLLQNDNARFGIYTNFELKVTIDRIR